MSEARPTASERLRRIGDDFLNRTAKSTEEMANTQAVADLLAMAVGNVLAISRMLNEGLDTLVRNARIAGRADVVSLSKQLARNEDKLERVLQLVERLDDQVEQVKQVQEVVEPEAAEEIQQSPRRAPSTRRRTASRPAAEQVEPASEGEAQ